MNERVFALIVTNKLRLAYPQFSRENIINQTVNRKNNIVSRPIKVNKLRLNGNLFDKIKIFKLVTDLVEILFNVDALKKLTLLIYTLIFHS